MSIEERYFEHLYYNDLLLHANILKNLKFIFNVRELNPQILENIIKTNDIKLFKFILNIIKPNNILNEDCIKKFIFYIFKYNNFKFINILYKINKLSKNPLKLIKYKKIKNFKIFDFMIEKYIENNIQNNNEKNINLYLWLNHAIQTYDINNFDVFFKKHFKYFLKINKEHIIYKDYYHFYYNIIILKSIVFNKFIIFKYLVKQLFECDFNLLILSAIVTFDRINFLKFFLNKNGLCPKIYKLLVHISVTNNSKECFKYLIDLNLQLFNENIKALILLSIHNEDFEIFNILKNKFKHIYENISSYFFERCYQDLKIQNKPKQMNFLKQRCKELFELNSKTIDFNFLDNQIDDINFIRIFLEEPLGNILKELKKNPKLLNNFTTDEIFLDDYNRKYERLINKNYIKINDESFNICFLNNKLLFQNMVYSNEFIIYIQRLKNNCLNFKKELKTIFYNNIKDLNINLEYNLNTQSLSFNIDDVYNPKYIFFKKQTNNNSYEEENEDEYSEHEDDYSGDKEEDEYSEYEDEDDYSGNEDEYTDYKDEKEEEIKEFNKNYNLQIDKTLLDKVPYIYNPNFNIISCFLLKKNYKYYQNINFEFFFNNYEILFEDNFKYIYLSILNPDKRVGEHFIFEHFKNNIPNKFNNFEFYYFFCYLGYKKVLSLYKFYNFYQTKKGMLVPYNVELDEIFNNFKFTNVNKLDCNICFNDSNELIKYCNFEHYYCKDCFNEAIFKRKKKCMICRN